MKGKFSLLTFFAQLFGNLGMAHLCATRNGTPLLFGLCFLLDTQATGAAIILTQMEVQRRAPAGWRGLVGSVCTGAFGCGAMVWVSLYDMVLKPDLRSHFVVSAAVSAVLLAFFKPVVFKLGSTVTKLGSDLGSTSTPPGGGAGGPKKVGVDWPKLRRLVREQDFIILCNGTLVTWSVALVFVAHVRDLNLERTREMSSSRLSRGPPVVGGAISRNVVYY